MEDMLPEISFADDADKARFIGDILHDHKGIDVIVLDLREAQAWTNFFIIATATSNTHMDGLDRHIKEFCREKEIEILRRSRKPDDMEDEWRIIDLGSIVIHLMSRRTRTFYDLERLYSLYSSSSSS